MRVDKRHQHEEAIVRRSDHPDLSVVLGYVFQKPLDCIVSIGRMIGSRAIQRASQGHIHYVLSFGSTLAPHILKHPNVTCSGEDIVATG